MLAADRVICILRAHEERPAGEVPGAGGEALVDTGARSRVALARCRSLPPERPYFLYVGSRAPYKNFGGLLRAFARVAAARPGLALCVVGGPFDEEERRLIGGLGLAGRTEHYGHAGDRQLAKLYRRSLALVYPSFYEARHPPLEARPADGGRVATRRASEVVGDPGWF